MKKPGFRWLALAAGLVAVGAVADDREARLGEEMRMNLFDGEVVTLATEEREFLAAWIDTADARGTVVLLHGRGFHADWPEVVGPLRVRLAEAGWNTLSLQLPVLAVDATYYDYLPTFADAKRRIDAGIAFAREQADGPVVVFAHSCGAHMIMHRIDDQGIDGIDALVTAGLGATDRGQDPVAPFPIPRIDVPYLDLLGSEEYERVLALAAERVDDVNASHAKSRQQFLADADHYFRGDAVPLGDAVSGWLDTVYPSR